MFIINAITISIAGEIGLILLGVLGGAIAGFFVSRAVFKRQLKKNPPVNRQMIKALYRQMGRTPSEAQLNQAMKEMNKYQ